MFQRKYGYARNATPAYIVNEEQDINEDYGFFYILDIDVPAKPTIRTTRFVPQTHMVTISHTQPNATTISHTQTNVQTNVVAISHAQPVVAISHVPDIIRAGLGIHSVHNYTPLYNIIYSVFKWIFQPQKIDECTGMQ